MIGTVQSPILLKATDFLFEEGRKILEERWERRKPADRALPAPEAVLSKVNAKDISPPDDTKEPHG